MINNPFNDMNNNEFLYQMCAFMGKENFIRFVNITSNKCIHENDESCSENCGECFYNFLGDYEKKNKL